MSSEVPAAEDQAEGKKKLTELPVAGPVIERLGFALTAMLMAGWIHLAIAPGHFEHAPAHGMFFGLLGVFQVLWVVAGLAWLGRRFLPSKAGRRAPAQSIPGALRHSGLALGGGAFVLWLLTQWLRTPFAAQPEPIDGPTILSKLAELGVLIALFGPLREALRRPLRLRRLATSALIGWVMWTTGLVAEARLPGLASEPVAADHTHGVGPDGEPLPVAGFGEFASAACRLAISLLETPDYDWGLPAGFPKPQIPEDNPMTAAKVELGRHLFYDPRLSGNGAQSCAGCHRQELAFTDGQALAVGSTGETHPRNSMALVNVAYNATLTWAHPELERLEDQIPTPMFGEHPVELGITGHEDEVLGRLRDDPRYGPLFQAAFPGDSDPVAWDPIVKALAAFTRSLISVDSAYDRFVYGKDLEALSPSAQRGMELFMSEDFECHHCHGGFNFSVASVHVATAFSEKVFHNTGLYDVGDGAYPLGNQGTFEITHRAEDMGKFRPPTLRNVAVTAPYMHDGSIATLEEVLDTYAAGGRHVREGPYAGDGRRNRFKSGFVPGFPITDQEKQDLLAFLHALTDESFLTDPRFSDPFVPQTSARLGSPEALRD